MSVTEESLKRVESSATDALEADNITKEQVLELWDQIPRPACGRDRRGAFMATFGMSNRSRREAVRACGNP